MAEEQLTELERLAKAATPGPWRVRRGSNYAWVEPVDFPHSPLVARAWSSQEDAAYIVAACNAVPDLIAEHRALRERVRELERQRDFLAKTLGDLCIVQKKDQCPLFYDCPAQQYGWSCGNTIKEDWIYAAEEAAKEAGE